LRRKRNAFKGGLNEHAEDENGKTAGIGSPTSKRSRLQGKGQAVEDGA